MSDGTAAARPADEFGAYLRHANPAPPPPRAYPPLTSSNLKGVQVAVKDLLLTDDGGTSTAASKMLESFVSPYEATVVKKLREAGMVITGKTNLDEFAMGSSTENSALGATVNPWDPARVPGGSSGGSAVAVAARDVPLALGTDTGSSVRLPAAYCGVVGMKPTYGRISRYGAIAMASSLDQVGVFSTSVNDAAVLLRVLSGHDPRDATSLDRPVPDYRKALTGDVKGLRIGLAKEYLVGGVQPEVSQAIRDAAKEFKAAGATVTEVSLPHTEYAIAAYYIITPAEVSSNLARYDGIRYGHSVERRDDWHGALEDVYRQSRAEGFGPEVKRRIMLGTYALSTGYYDAYYKKAMEIRTLVKRDFDDAFKKVDVILTPTAPTTAFKLGEKTGDPLAMYLSDIFTVPANLAGLPGISIPAGFDADGLPIGLQLMGAQWDEETVFRAAHAYEQRHDWHEREPGS